MYRLRGVRLSQARDLCTSCGTRMTKKDLTGVFPSVYSREVEEGWYPWWKSSGFFAPTKKERRMGEKSKFSMVLPPPNVTGVLHLGHALTVSVQDALVRYHRMRGCDTVWVPGSDHAGLATQIVVEKQLKATEGVSRHDLGRDEFVKRVWAWRKDKGDTILGQLEEMGASLDWERTQFTLSPEFSTKVQHAFVTLFDKGIIYRSESLVNWSCELQSTISDIEVSHVQVDAQTYFDIPGYSEPVPFGVMTDIAYKVTNSEEEIIVSTTRPETMLGDTAIAVHPEDPRYSHLIGRSVFHPFRHEEIPIIADEYVDQDFGTGAVKITPAHDPNDFEIGARHDLRNLNILNSDGTLNAAAGEFEGQHRFFVRSEICERLSELGLYRGEKDHAMSIPVCGRSGDVVEPLLKHQWFINTSKVGELASRAVKDKDLKLDPDSYAAVWQTFMGQDKTRDWCISRQLWWGHRIPAWFCFKAASKENGVWVAADSIDSAKAKASAKLGCEQSEVTAEQDDDVLDTWFSSGIYPFAVFGWPDKTNEDLSRFFPLDLMETGHDILFFWVARMVMLSIALVGKLPFHDVMLHGIICDQQGRKMSKSLGNVIDPMHMIHGASLDKLNQELDLSVRNGYLSGEEVELSKSNISQQFPEGIPASGADPLRWALLSYDVKSSQINLDAALVKQAGAWCNKIWQVARLLNNTHDLASSSGKSLASLPKDFQPGLMDMWILHQLANTVTNVNTHFEERELQSALKEIRSFLYGDVCDVYVEYIKPNIRNPENPAFMSSLLFLHTSVLSAIKMIHPVMPFITEELYQRLPKLPNERRQESIMVDSYPQGSEWSGFVNPILAELMDTALKVVAGVRSIKSNYSLVKGARPEVTVCVPGDFSVDDLNQLSEIIERLAKCGSVTFTAAMPELESLAPGCAVTSADDITIAVNLGPLLDTEKELNRINAKIAKNKRDEKKLKKSLKGKFQFRLSEETVAERRGELAGELEKLEAQLNLIQRLQSESRNS